MADFSSYTHKFRAVTNDASHQNGASKVSKRNRQPISCGPCRLRKLKCDRGHPCETCTKRGEADACAYGGSVSSFKTAAPKQDTNGRRSKAQDRLQHLESLVMQMMNEPSNGSSRSATSTDPSTIASSESPSGPAAITAHTYQNGQGHFRVEGNEAKYVGSTHWSAILDNINELKSAIVSEHVPPDSDGEENEMHDSDTLFGLEKPQSLARILQQYLPARVQIDRRLSGYFNAKYLTLPIVHCHQFQREYEHFWKAPTATPPLWVAILFSIMCLSATLGQAVGTEPSVPEGIMTPRDSFMTAAAQCLTLGGYTKPKKYVVEALALFAQCKYLASLDPSRESGIIFCIITRLAFRMGYHRDPDHFSSFSKFEGEMRRRTWAMCRQFDLMISFQLGLPNNIPPDSFDTKYPRNLLDADFDEHTTVLPSARPETEATPILYFVVKNRLMNAFAKICHHALTFGPTPAGEVDRLHAEVNAAHATIPEPLRIRPMAQSFADPSYLIMVRMNCEFLYRKSVCVLHRKYMVQGREFSRNACVESSLAILGHLIDLQKEFQPGGQLHADRWMISSFTMNDFLLAAMLLCLALTMAQKKQSQSDAELQESRVHLQVLKQAHAICLELGTTGKEARRVAEALGIMLAKLEPKLTSHHLPSPQQDLLLSPLSLNEVQSQTQPPSQPPLELSLFNSTMGPGNLGLFNQFDNILGGTEDVLDWTAFDQYLQMESNGSSDIGQDWTSTPYRFLGQPSRTADPSGDVNANGTGSMMEWR